jgi:hypothetical protein
MNNWTPKSMERLYELYEQHFEHLHQIAEVTNLSLGSPNPNSTRLERLTRSQFEAVCNGATSDRKVIELWIRRIIRDHENEFSAQLLVG